MALLEMIQFLVAIYLIGEILIPAIRGTKYFPIIRCLRFNRKIAEANTAIDQEQLRQELYQKEDSLKEYRLKNVKRRPLKQGEKNG